MKDAASTEERLVGPQFLKGDAEPVMMAYYRTWRDVAMPSDSNTDLPDPNVIRMTDIPADIDIVSVFHYVRPGTDEQAFWDTLRDDYVPTLHERGQKVVLTVDYSALLEIQEETGKDSSTLTTEDYHAFAEKFVAERLTPWNLDGLDIDMEEPNLIENQIKIVANVMKELSEVLEIEEGSDKILIYDTNQENHALFTEIAPYISYVFVQAYGRELSSLDKTWDLYKKDISSTQFLFGISYPEEQDHNKWDDTVGDYEESRAYNYALWQPEGGEKGGLFVYAIDRDGKEYGDDTITATDYSWTKRLTQTLKEAHAEL